MIDDKGRVFVRARTLDGRWASVSVMDLDDRSFRVFVLRSMASNGLVASVVDREWPDLTTPLTKAQVEGES